MKAEELMSIADELKARTEGFGQDFIRENFPKESEILSRISKGSEADKLSEIEHIIAKMDDKENETIKKHGINNDSEITRESLLACYYIDVESKTNSIFATKDVKVILSYAKNNGPMIDDDFDMETFNNMALMIRENMNIEDVVASFHEQVSMIHDNLQTLEAEKGKAEAPR